MSMKQAIVCQSLLLLKAAFCSSFIPLSLTSFRPAAGSAVGIPSTNGADDLFDYFDPLLSPHAYPNGVRPGEQPLDLVSKRGMGPAEDEALSDSLPKTPVEPDHLFDPTRSPHEYPSGTPARVVGDDSRRPRRTGILLIDHGSRRADANQRLSELARMYKQSLGDDSTIVEAAHMELAPPTIQDGIATLLEAGVDEIICHPYFLSPGRHVQEDIPQLIKAATETLNVEIPIITTDPLGSNTDLMIQAIDGMVRKASLKVDQSR